MTDVKQSLVAVRTKKCFDLPSPPTQQHNSPTPHLFHHLSFAS
ncbi:hypothetical protein SLEP1_g43208 [Rubroshorea leprosula]|uniref:Uncharacterized protein n=1 Tax=Rubroshorea leprosula TaxID=152421 RepID=A0AAV5LD74_9ROSI|nr:hypothetical protein SLEP1_g43208 [Rubroshorea leprosula]